MYEEFYGLREKPFNLTPDPRFFFLSENHRGAFEHLLYGIGEREGFILITGEVGTGKTTLCRALLNRIEPNATDTALVFNPMLSEQELLQCVLSDFGIESKATSKKGLLDELNQFLLRQLAAKRNTILIIDEAQTLSLPVLEEVRMLSNLETEKEKLLQIVLMGQIELREKLSLPQLRQLNQRISIRYHLRPLGKDEVPRYIQHRLMIAGSSGDVHFTSEALWEIYRYSQGIPRLINLASDRALLAGYAEQSREMRLRTVLRGLNSLEGQEDVSSGGGVKKRLGWGFAGLAIFCLGLVAAALFSDFAWVLFRKIAAANGPRSLALFDEASDQLNKAGGTPVYRVQLGSYKSEAESMEVAQRVKTADYPLFLAKDDASDGPARHRLYIGEFTEKAEAERLAKTFKKAEGVSEIKVILSSSEVSEKRSP